MRGQWRPGKDGVSHDEIRAVYEQDKGKFKWIDSDEGLFGGARVEEAWLRRPNIREMRGRMFLEKTAGFETLDGKSGCHSHFHPILRGDTVGVAAT